MWQGKDSRQIRAVDEVLSMLLQKLLASDMKASGIKEAITKEVMGQT